MRGRAGGGRPTMSRSVRLLLSHSRTKENAPSPRIRRSSAGVGRTLFEIPCVAIGGITPENAGGYWCEAGGGLPRPGVAARSEGHEEGPGGRR
jgi:hypothetical protein